MTGLLGPNGEQKPLGADITKGTLIVCEKCKNSTFEEVFLLFNFSALVSPTGKEENVPLHVPACNACGHINQSLLPPVVKRKAEEASSPKITL